MSNRHVADRRRSGNTPPGFGRGKGWGFRTIEWQGVRGGRCHSLIMNGTPVDERYYAYYWAERQTYEEVLAALKAARHKLQEYLLIGIDSRRVVGALRPHPADDADALAWMSCWFAAELNWTLAFIMPAGLDASGIKNSNLGYFERGPSGTSIMPT